MAKDIYQSLDQNRYLFQSHCSWTNDYQKYICYLSIAFVQNEKKNYFFEKKFSCAYLRIAFWNRLREKHESVLGNVTVLIQTWFLSEIKSNSIGIGSSSRSNAFDRTIHVSGNDILSSKTFHLTSTRYKHWIESFDNTLWRT